MKHLKRAIIGLLLALLVSAPQGRAFEDVPAESPYYFAVQYLTQQRVFLDGKKFDPEVKISKAEFVKYLIKLNAPSEPLPEKIDLPFLDTVGNAWYAPYFQKAIEIGILENKKEKINPYKTINQAEALEWLFHSKSIPIPRVTRVTLPYRDLAAKKSIVPLAVRALELKLIEPESSTFLGLFKPLTRGNAAQMIYRMEVATIDIGNRGEATKTESASLKKFLRAWDLVHKTYLKSKEIDDAQLIDAALKEMVKTLGDPYSVFMNPEENKSLADDLNGEVEGIGAYIGMEKEAVTIIAPIKDSPAYRAGVKAGDIVRSVDGVNVDGMSLTDVVKRIKGKKGTTVTLTLVRAGSVINIKIVRDIVPINSVELQIESDIAIIKLSQFGQKTMDEMQNAVRQITADPQIKGFILDLRDDPGGFLDTAIGVLGILLPQQSVAVNVKYTHFNFSQFTTGKGELSHYPMVILINKGSASASEIVAGALQDLKIATVIGETSFGKGTVQEINFFEDQSSLKLTVAEWLTSLGKSIQSVGITPDIIVKKGEGEVDNQLERAKQELRNKIQ